jgi:hypothetical protein
MRLFFICVTDSNIRLLRICMVCLKFKGSSLDEKIKVYISLFYELWITAWIFKCVTFSIHVNIHIKYIEFQQKERMTHINNKINK